MPLAVVANSRSPLFPDVPTLKEARGEHYPATWFGLFTPAGCRGRSSSEIARDVDRIMAEPSFPRGASASSAASSPRWSATDEFARFIAAERKFAAQIVKESGEQPK